MHSNKSKYNNFGQRFFVDKTNMTAVKREFKIGDVVQIGSGGEKGRIIDIIRPLGTYCMYKVHMYFTGAVETAAKHELIKGLPDHEFQDLFDCYNIDELNSADSAKSMPMHNITNCTLNTPHMIHQTPSALENAVDCPLTVNSENDPFEELSLDDAFYNDLDEVFGTCDSMKVPVVVSSAQVPASESTETLTSKQNVRFAPLPSDPKIYRDTLKNKRTEEKTKSHVALVQSFLSSKSDSRPVHLIPPVELDTYLQEFVIRVRQKNGDEYEPSTIRGMIGSLDRHLQENDYVTTISRGKEFTLTMATLRSKGKELKRKGKGNRDHAADALSDEELDKLYEAGQLGNHCPESIINTLWYNNTLHFGIRGGGTEHRQLMWGDVQLGLDSANQTEYLEFNERQTKTRTGIDPSNIRRQKPRMYATGTARCPVETYKVFANQRPEKFSGDEDPFYLAVVTHNRTPALNDQWFLRGPIGRNKLNNLLKSMALKADLPELQFGKRITNTSVRKRLCQKLLENDVPDTRAVHVTGHKNASSLNNYRTLTTVQQKSISDLLASSSSTTSVQANRNNNTAVSATSQSVSNHAAFVSLPANCAFSLFSNTTITGGTFNITLQQPNAIEK